ncbi:LRR receptor-like serine/threonine-protein kinase RPK2 [Populus nigra]|uniref:LRR receptor-like serine/threonine-protein kinase RPK2 n=1 Tax=Populus nigra TaxID=3691 RepID=UPI002B26C4BA|nr:LRR receptor-like serine/threonine-protein kinase RPK2 [Populus nigra]XP_061962284.1 LRR receptor-like serine/threonine-protein kinase RPK2 [Populus nigra]XP_061962286.1 LRR receptor-like serine/threonine-protein kinase RPK2 [Populus nigra]
MVVAAAAAWFLLVGGLAATFSAEALSFNDSASGTLLSFKNSILGDPSNLLSSWNLTTNPDYCTWYGVTCQKSSNTTTEVVVIALNFSGTSTTRLSGTLPESIQNLPYLRTLVLSHNCFSGEIPAGSIAKLSFLEVLELQGNNFSGKIPQQISTDLHSLRFLNLSFNSFTGDIPATLIGFGKLRVIDLSNNRLTGGMQLVSSSKCLFLRHLKLSNNLLENNIPKDIGHCKNLRTLLLDGNILQGPIPAEIGQLPELRVLDVSTNSLTQTIPKELGYCRKLSVLVLTNSSNFVGDNAGTGGSLDGFRLEFNAFEGGVPQEVLMLPSLQILWAPRANLDGRLPDNWSDSCSLRVLHLGQNSLRGVVPKGLVMCKNLTFLDLSSNYLTGDLPMQLQVPCMIYFNVSQNNISGAVPTFGKGSCDTSIISYGQDPNFFYVEDIQIAYANIPFWGSHTLLGSMAGADFVIVHDFSWNHFVGSLPLFSVGEEFLVSKNRTSYRLLLSSNGFTGSLPGKLVSNCNDLLSFSVNLSTNHMSGEIPDMLLNCLPLREFEAADNEISGFLAPSIGNLRMLRCLDLRRNRLSGSLPNELGNLKFLKSVLLGMNNLTGEIPSEFGQLSSLTVLDLSHNAVTGSIPVSLTSAKNLEIVLLNNNDLSGEIPPPFSNISSLVVLNVSFNNLSGHIPHLQHPIDCDWFRGNIFLDKCLDQSSNTPPGEVQLSHGDGKWRNHRKKSFLIAVVTSASVVLCVSLVVVLFSFYGKKKSWRLSSLRGKVVVTFADAPAELTYDSVVRATGNFSMRNLIGTGGFGSTYKAELVPGYFIAVKRLSIGRFQGIQQFDAEIITLGRIRHKNLVTLIGYYVAEAEMFLIYNYLSGGNLETFIHDRPDTNVQWPVIHKIALDIAQALAYLHYSCAPRILHRDIKPSNILLDEELNAYLSDFGLAKLLEVSQTHATTDVAGTFGYVAPEYATTCRVSDKSDVYSFGVVLLELMSGKKSLDPSFSEYGNGFNIVAWAKLLIKERRSSELFAPELWETGPNENLLGMLKLASSCTVDSLSVRPSMKQVLEKLKQLKP